ncbi:EamA domain-containing membrane protein RarD [Flavobacteriaceae bacterium MAR_2010_72]|nr:EamA domain-containing membrane protein RarD [Flavobacteriaceae bacterium MAR_2010_72]TVZ59743.1 EamA domain-containing membrane protein RarD [Flavobacteriaceae bacterium MAR_2010_105]
MAISRSRLLIILSFFAIYVIWGSTYLLNKIVVKEVAPLMLASIRFISAGIMMVLIAAFLKLNLKISRRQLTNCIIAGFLFLAFGNGIFVWALKYVDSGFAALEAATQPLFVIFLMRILHGTKIKAKSLFGVVLGIIGMYLLVSQDGLIVSEHSVIGMVMILFCVLSWSYASIFVSKADLPSSFFVSTAYQMLSAGAILLGASWIIGETWKSPLEWSTSAQWSMLLLIIFGSIVAFTAFNYLLKVVSTEKVSTSAYVNPVIALVLGMYVLDEFISIQSLIAAAFLLTGVYFINSKKKFVMFSRFSKK